MSILKPLADTLDERSPFGFYLGDYLLPLMMTIVNFVIIPLLIVKETIIEDHETISN